MVSIITLYSIYVATKLHICTKCHNYYINGRQNIPVIVRKLFPHKFSEKEINLLQKISFKESSFINTASIPNGSSYGLFGFLNSTFKKYGFKRTDCPWCQTKLGVLYIIGRYKTFIKAWVHHLAYNWY